MADVGKLVREIQANLLDDGVPSPDRVRKVLGWAQASLDEAYGRWARLTTGSYGGDANLAQIGSDLKRAANLFDYYADQLAELGTEDADEEQLRALYERVTAPLIEGQCYGPPSCSQAIIEQTGAPFAIAPRFVEPFKLQNAMDVRAEAGSENLQLLWDDLRKSATKVVETGANLGRLAFILGGLYLAGKVLD